MSNLTTQKRHLADVLKKILRTILKASFWAFWISKQFLLVSPLVAKN